MGESGQSPIGGKTSGLDLFKGLLEAAPDAIVIVNHDGRIVLVNSATEGMFGYNRKELLGQPVEILVPERFFQEHVIDRAKYVAEARARPMGLPLDLFARRKDGSEFPADISLSPMATEDGLLVIAAVRDVTERKRMEATLRASRELSTPVLPVGEHFLIVPVIGVIDTARARQLTDQLLLGIRTHRAKVVVMDVTGVAAIETEVANYLVQTMKKARLLGATLIVTGVSSEIARTLVALSVDLGGVLTMGDLQAGIREAERLLGDTRGQAAGQASPSPAEPRAPE